MRRLWFAALAVAAVQVVHAGNWKGDVAKKAVGRAVRRGLQQAAREAALSAALDAASNVVVRGAATYTTSGLHDLDEYTAVSAAVGDGIESAMRAADVAERLDNVADAARTVKKIGKIRKLKR